MTEFALKRRWEIFHLLFTIFSCSSLLIFFSLLLFGLNFFRKVIYFFLFNKALADATLHFTPDITENQIFVSFIDGAALALKDIKGWIIVLWALRNVMPFDFAPLTNEVGR